MIRVDVKQAQPDDWRRGFNIEVSVDGGPFVNHWFLATRGKNEVEARLSAASDGRIYAAGIKFGGGDVRMTAFYNDVYVPDMSTIVAFEGVGRTHEPPVAEEVEAAYKSTHIALPATLPTPTGHGS